MADFNPRRSIDKENSFVFFGKNAIKPVNQRLFNKYLNRALEDCGYPNPEKIKFHCWRHAFCSEAKTLINDDRYWQKNAGFPVFFMIVGSPENGIAILSEHNTDNGNDGVLTYGFFIN